MMALTLDVVAETLFGANLSAQARELGRAMEAVMLHAQHLFDTPITLPAPGCPRRDSCGSGPACAHCTPSWMTWWSAEGGREARVTTCWA